MVRLPLVLCVLLLLAAPASAAEDVWWLGEWPYRNIVSVASPDPSGEVNTALVEVETGGKAAPEGRDVRVLEAASGRPAPYRVLGLKGGVARVEFLVRRPEALRYHVYYGNPKAPAESHTWERKVGGLTLAIYENTLRQAPRSWHAMRQLLRQCQNKVAEGPRRKIDDVVNPFGKPDDFYIGVYKGRIFCRETGIYGFASNSDDASFMRVDGKLVASLPGAHDVLVNFEMKGGRGSRIHLERGIHDIEYYHVEQTGDQLARAGWQPPWGKAVKTIPASAFIRELRVETLARQGRDRGLSAFFNYLIADAVSFRGSKAAFVTVAFRSRITSRLSKPALWQWDFGDGHVSREPNPTHRYAGAGVYTVRLHCEDALGYRDDCVRRVTARSDEPRRLEALLEVETGEAVLKPTQPIQIAVKVRGSGPDRWRCRLFVDLRDPNRRLLRRSESEALLERVRWQQLDQTVTTRRLPPRFLIEARLELDGQTLRRQVVRVEPPESSTRDELKVVNGGFVNPEGERVVFRLNTDPHFSPVKPFRKRVREGGRVRICVVDDSLAPLAGDATGATYVGALKRRLRRRFPGLSVDVARVGGQALAHHDPLRRVALAPREVALQHPDLVIVAVSLRDLQNNLDPDRQELLLYALTDRIRGATRAEVVLVTPPPVIVNPERSKEYALRTIRVALKRGLKLANVYNAFARMGRKAWERLFQDPDEPDVVYLYPNREGQERIAEVIADTILR